MGEKRARLAHHHRSTRAVRNAAPSCPVVSTGGRSKPTGSCSEFAALLTPGTSLCGLPLNTDRLLGRQLAGHPPTASEHSMLARLFRSGRVSSWIAAVEKTQR